MNKPESESPAKEQPGEQMMLVPARANVQWSGRLKGKHPDCSNYELQQRINEVLDAAPPAALRRSQPEGEPATEAVLEEVAKMVEAIAEPHYACGSDQPVGHTLPDCPFFIATRIRALKGKGASQGAEGMVRVPREPTQEMLRVAALSLDENAATIAAAYRAMLQAAEASKDAE